MWRFSSWLLWLTSSYNIRQNLLSDLAESQHSVFASLNVNTGTRKTFFFTALQCYQVRLIKKKLTVFLTKTCPKHQRKKLHSIRMFCFTCCLLFIHLSFQRTSYMNVERGVEMCVLLFSCFKGMNLCAYLNINIHELIHWGRWIKKNLIVSL